MTPAKTKKPSEFGRAVVLAGGKGTRLHPYTTILPKPLLPVCDRPILERVLRRLGESGFKNITISVGHLAELIQAVCGDGRKWKLNLEYAIEDEPLGTIGPLAFIRDLGENFLVMNGDVLTDLDLAALWKAHLASGAALTVATFHRDIKIDFGVLSYDRWKQINHFEEKPTLPYDVSMGVYILNRRCLDFVPKGKPFGFDQLVLALLEVGQPVRAYPHEGQWLDLGRAGDYECANAEFQDS
jgi:NDP-sugar pyrophosphorylase family protein